MKDWCPKPGLEAQTIFSLKKMFWGAVVNKNTTDTHCKTTNTTTHGAVLLVAGLRYGLEGNERGVFEMLSQFDQPELHTNEV